MAAMGNWAGDPHVSPQFMNPTKVIHLRNLPFEVTVEEIREFCAPWGTVAAVKDKVGAMKNQAFVEFAGIEQAIAIVTHYAHAVEPAKLRGRPTWMSFSGRDKLTNVSPVTDAPTPVLQITIPVPPPLAQTVTLDLLNSLISPYGFVRKIVTHSKADGTMLCWAQFLDAATANAVKLSLGGQAIPRSMLGEYPTPVVMEMVFSTHLDLLVRTNSYCTRDFTDGSVPWGEPEWPMVNGLLPSGPEGGGNVLSIQFDNMTYPVTLDGIHTIFSTYGQVQKIHIYEREGKTNALVQYSDAHTADVARSALQGHAMYDGGHNVMHVTYSKHKDLTIRHTERSKDYTTGAGGAAPAARGPTAPQAAASYAPPAAVPAQHAGPAPAVQYGGAPAAHAAPYAVAQATAPHPGSGFAAPPPGAQYAGGPPPPAQPQHDPNFHVTGEDYVKQHERVLEQHGGRTSGRGAAAPYAQQAAPAAPAPAAAYPSYQPPAPAAPPAAYPQQAQPVGYYVTAPPAAPPPGTYYIAAAPPPYPPPGMPAYGALPMAAPAYGAAPPGIAYGAAPPPYPPPAYGQQPGYGQQLAYGQPPPPAAPGYPAGAYGAYPGAGR